MRAYARVVCERYSSQSVSMIRIVVRGFSFFLIIGLRRDLPMTNFMCVSPHDDS